MRCSNLLALSLLSASASARTIELSAGADFEAECLQLVEPGDTCYLNKGDYEHDGLTRKHGTEDNPITITGHSEACIKGSNTQDRVLQIAHDYYVIDGICFDGKHDDDYVATAIYVLGADRKSKLDKNGYDVYSSVTGTKLLNLEIKNFASECIHFRYFVTWSEVSGCTVQNCGIDAFEKGKGSKVGEGLYLGCALDQTKDGKAPEPKIRGGSSDNVESDVCTLNWVHHNTFRTYGNECVDVKEGSTNNLIENNVCEQQKDPNSGCFGLRGSENTVRFNEIAECDGAGVRMGGDDGFGGGNNIYGNVIQNAGNGAFNVMSPDQGAICENQISGTTSAEGEFKEDPEYALDITTSECSSYPGDLGSGSSGSGEAGVNYADGGEESVEIVEVETNESEGTPGQGDCTTVLTVSQVEVEHSQYVDHDTDNLFDGDLDTYFSVNRETTSITFELEGDQDVNGVAIGFFMKSEEEERIQTFDIALKKDDDNDWTTVISRKESSGDYNVIQTFPFATRTAAYIRFESHGNTFNNWTPLTEIEICGASAAAETNALFGGVEAVKNDVEQLNTALAVCPSSSKLSPVKAKTQGGSGNVMELFDGNFKTRWSTDNTFHEQDLDNDMVHLTLQGDSYLSSISMALFDGHLASQYFAVYTKSATATTWSPVEDANGNVERKAADHEGLQHFAIGRDRVTHIYIVGKGNEMGDFTKISELEMRGC